MSTVWYVASLGILTQFWLGSNFLKNLYIFSIFVWNISMRVSMNCQKIDLQGLKVRKRSKLDNFSKTVWYIFVCTAYWGWYWSTFKRWIWLIPSEGHFRKVNFGPFVHNYVYYSVVIEWIPNCIAQCSLFGGDPDNVFSDWWCWVSLNDSSMSNLVLCDLFGLISQKR